LVALRATAVPRQKGWNLRWFAKFMKKKDVWSVYLCSALLFHTSSLVSKTLNVVRDFGADNTWTAYATTNIQDAINAYRPGDTILKSMSRQGFGQDKWRLYSSSGHWNDPDMIEFTTAEQKQPGPRPDEEYTHLFT
jgi:hypothetical protein